MNRRVGVVMVAALLACGGDATDRAAEQDAPRHGGPAATAASGRPVIEFAAYPVVERFRDTPRQPDFTRDTAARQFRTRLRWAPGDTVNFAAHFRLVTWGCGTECQGGALVDARTGAVHWLPEPARVGYAFRVDSRLMVVDPPGEIEARNAGYPPGAVPEPLRSKHYVWADTGWEPVGVAPAR